MKKILQIVVSKQGKYGGGENICELIFSHLKQPNLLVTNSKKLYNNLQKEGNDRVYYYAGNKLSFLNFIKLAWFIRTILKRNSISSIISHHRYSTLASVLARTLAPQVEIIHYIHYFTERRSLIPFFVKRFIAVSNVLKKHWIELHKVLNRKIEVIFNGIEKPTIADEIVFDFKKVNCIDNQYYNCCILGRLDPVKGHSVLFKALRKLIDNGYKIKLYVIGDGIIMENLIGLVKELNLTKNVVFLGFVQNPVNILPSFDLLIQPSLTEGLPFTLIEAIAVKIGVVASDIDPIKEVVGINYPFLAAKGSDVSLAKVLEDYINLPNKDKDKLRNELYQRYNNLFTLDQMIKKIEKTVL